MATAGQTHKNLKVQQGLAFLLAALSEVVLLGTRSGSGENLWAAFFLLTAFVWYAATNILIWRQRKRQRSAGSEKE